MTLDALSLSGPAQSGSLSTLVVRQTVNHPPFISNERFELARMTAQPFRDLVRAVVGNVSPLVESTAFPQLLEVVLAERVATALLQTFRRLDQALRIRFHEQRLVDNEQYLIVVTDVLTGQESDFLASFGGGKAAQQWKLERLLELTGEAVNG